MSVFFLAFFVRPGVGVVVTEFPEFIVVGSGCGGGCFSLTGKVPVRGFDG